MRARNDQVVKTQRLQRSLALHGLLVLAPVLFLAILGFVALRRDRLMAEQEAQQRAKELADSLATPIQMSLGFHLVPYGAAYPPGMAPNDYPPRLHLDARGNLLQPVPRPVAPQAPEWLLRLSHEERDRWETARELELSDNPKAREIYDEFARNVSLTEVRANATLAAARITLNTKTPEDAANQWLALIAQHGAVTSETGLPLANVAFLHALRLAEQNSNLVDTVLQALPDQVEKFPSMLVPRMLKGGRALASLGADDYLIKPFSIQELLARVRALLRRVQRASEVPRELSLGDLRIDFERQEVRHHGNMLHLTAKEFAMLRLLAEARGQPVTRERFLDVVWGYAAFPTTRTVDNHVASLRAKLEPMPQTPCWIKTVHGVGYRLEVHSARGAHQTLHPHDNSPPAPR